MKCENEYYHNKQIVWNTVNGIISGSGIYTITKKFQLTDHDLYLKTGWHYDRIVVIDITIGNDTGYACESAGLDISRYTLSRTMVELACRDASKMLQSGVFDIGDITNGWKGIEGFPSGVCEQLGNMQRGPLPCAAMIIEDRFEEWKQQSLLYYGLRDAENV